MPLRNYRPFTNKATVALLVVVMVGFGLFAESQVNQQPGRCDAIDQADNSGHHPLTLVLF